MAQQMAALRYETPQQVASLKEHTAEQMRDGLAPGGDGARDFFDEGRPHRRETQGKGLCGAHGRSGVIRE
eukprot:7182842-Prymnesium_polylepis.1